MRFSVRDQGPARKPAKSEHTGFRSGMECKRQAVGRTMITRIPQVSTGEVAMSVSITGSIPLTTPMPYRKSQPILKKVGPGWLSPRG